MLSTRETQTRIRSLVDEGADPEILVDEITTAVSERLDAMDREQRSRIGAMLQTLLDEVDGIEET